MTDTSWASIEFHGDHYVFNFKDENGFVVTDGKNLEELYSNIKEAMDLHFQSQTYTINLSTPIRFHITNDSYATHI